MTLSWPKPWGRNVLVLTWNEGIFDTGLIVPLSIQKDKLISQFVSQTLKNETTEKLKKNHRRIKSNSVVDVISSLALKVLRMDSKGTCLNDFSHVPTASMAFNE